MSEYWEMQAETLRKQLTKARRDLQQREIQVSQARFIGGCGWAVAVSLFLLGLIK